MGKVSVAMATYNGEKYILEQLESILINLSYDDEIIISDDGSKDRTREIIKSINDERIKLIDGPEKGIKKNFENAIKACSNKYIFLSDQDDIWSEDKVAKVLPVFLNEKCVCVVHNCSIVNEKKEVLEESFFDYRKSGSGVAKNIYKNTYIGCCMAFDSALKGIILPIPDNIEMHDQWIGVLSDLTGKTKFLNDKLILYRRHECNSSEIFKHHPLKKMIRNRIIFIKEIILRKNSIRKNF